MRKHRIAIAAFAAVLALTGCGKTTDNGSAGTQGTGTAVSSTASEETTPLRLRNVEEMVTLCDYKNLTVTVASPEIDDASVESLLNSVYLSAITAETGGILDRAVENGDTVCIDFEGKKDGVAFDGGTSTDYDLEIGSGSFIDGFEAGLIGVMPGETVDLNLTFPEGYKSEELAGQAVVFTVKVNFIRPSHVAMEDMRDDVIESIGLTGVTTVEEFKTFISSYLGDSAQESYESEIENAIIDKLITESTFQNLPQDILTTYQNRILSNIQDVSSTYSVSPDEYCNYYYGLSASECAVYYGEMSLRQDIAIQAIANAEGMNLSDEEFDSMMQYYVTAAGMESLDAYLSYIGSESAEDYRGYFLNTKVLDYLKGITTVVEE